MYIGTCTESAKKEEIGSFHWCPVTGQKEMGTNCRAWARCTQRALPASAML